MSLVILKRDDFTPYAHMFVKDRQFGPIPPSGAEHFPSVSLEFEPKTDRTHIFRMLEKNDAMMVIAASVAYDNGYRVKQQDLCFESSYFAPEKVFKWSTCDAAFLQKLEQKAEQQNKQQPYTVPKK
jgi:hypothetical protein